MTYKNQHAKSRSTFRLLSHNFNPHAKLTLIEQLNNTQLDKGLQTFKLKKQKVFWMHKLKTLKLHGFILNLIALTLKISAFFVQISLTGPYAGENAIMLQRHIGRKTDVQVVNSQKLTPKL